MIDKTSAEWKWGRWAEEIIADFLQDDGYRVYPLMNIERNGGAPLLLGRDGNLVSMDMQAVKQGKIILVESKWKQAPDHFRIKNSWRHGIDTYLWEQYQAIEKEFQVRCFLAFVEQKSETCAQNQGRPRILIADFDTLREYACPSIPNNSYADLVYWDIDTTPFRVILIKNKGIQPVVLPARTIRDWEKPAKDGSLPRENFLRKKQQQPSLFSEHGIQLAAGALCGSMACGGCYDIGDGKQIHPPRDKYDQAKLMKKDE